MELCERPADAAAVASGTGKLCATWLPGGQPAIQLLLKLESPQIVSVNQIKYCLSIWETELSWADCRANVRALMNLNHNFTPNNHHPPHRLSVIRSVVCSFGWSILCVHWLAIFTQTTNCVHLNCTINNTPRTYFRFVCKFLCCFLPLRRSVFFPFLVVESCFYAFLWKI